MKLMNVFQMLMIVIVIIGVVYVLAITSLKKIGDKSQNLTLLTLPKYMESIHSHDELLLSCIDNCKACYLFRDGEFEEEIDPFMDEDIRVYEYDVNLGANEIFFTPFYDKDGREFDVCFEYKLSREDVHSEMAIETPNGVIAYPSYFGEPQVYKSLEDYADKEEELRQRAID